MEVGIASSVGPPEVPMTRRLVLPALAIVLLLAPCGAQAQAPSSPGSKPPELRTALPPALSPALSADQLAKQGLAPAAAPVQAPVAGPGVKPVPALTARPPVPGFALRPRGGSASTLLPWRDPAVLARIARPDGVVAPAPKPAALATSRPLAPEQAAIVARQQAHKLDHAHVEISAPAGRKPPAQETRGPAPATLAPSQHAKHAQDAARRPQ
jgi:hypothetical protein